MALAFHRGFTQAVISMVQELAAQQDFKTVALSGGVLQNRLLSTALVTQLREQGYQVLTHQQLPANDAGLAFGQALIAAAQQIKASASS